MFVCSNRCCGWASIAVVMGHSLECVQRSRCLAHDCTSFWHCNKVYRKISSGSTPLKRRWIPPILLEGRKEREANNGVHSALPTTSFSTPSRRTLNLHTIHHSPSVCPPACPSSVHPRHPPSSRKRKASTVQHRALHPISFSFPFFGIRSVVARAISCPPCLPTLLSIPNSLFLLPSLPSSNDDKPRNDNGKILKL